MHFEPAVNTKREMTINLPNLFFDRNIYLRVLEIVFQGVQVAKIPGDHLVFSGFALAGLTAIRSKLPDEVL